MLGGSSGASQAGGALSSLPNIGQNTASWQALMGQNIGNANYLQSMMPQIQQLFSSQFNNPYASQMQTGAGTAGTALQNIGQTGLNNSSVLGQGGGTMLAQMQGLLNSGFDPQSQLYNQQKQNATDQANVQAAQMGLQGPYAAALKNSAMQNFDSNWTNQQLGRQIAGTQAAGAAGTQGANLMSQGMSQGATGAQDIYAGAGMPYNAYQTVGQGQQNAFSNLFGNVGQVSGQEQQAQQQLMNYIQAALGQEASRYGAMRQGAQEGAAGGSMFGGDMGNLIMQGLPIAMSFL